MLQSPAKRRRVTSPDVETGDQDNTETAPRTPTRASYLSPTKSSLARSHPHLITRSARRATTEPRGKALRDEILKNRPTDSDVPKTISKIVQTVHQAVDDPVQEQIDQNLADQDQIEGQKESYDTNGQSPETNSFHPHSKRPLLPANRSKTRDFNEMAFSPPIMPTLIRKTDSAMRARSRPGSDEPELPPTPVQLGLSSAPERPRGLASSSSPRGSKSSSGTPRKRTRAGAAVTSSPLKPKAPPPAPARNDAMESGPYDIDEAPESEPEEREDGPNISRHPGQLETQSSTHSDSQLDGAIDSHQDTNTNLLAEEHVDSHASQQENDANPQEEAVPIADGRLSDDLPPELEEQQAILQRLRAQLSLLKEENKKLETFIGNEEAIEDEDLAIIRQSLLKDGTSLSNSAQASATQADLTKFLPANLEFRSRTETATFKRRVKLVHVLTVTTSAPWLPNMFAFALKVIVDAESGRVEEVELKDVRASRPSRAPRHGIWKWATERLQKRRDSLGLHQFDVGGTIWAMGKWFEAAVVRATAFRLLDLQYNNPGSSNHEDELRKTDGRSPQEVAIELTKYLEMTQIKFEACPPAHRRPSQRFKPKVMLVWDIHVDWAGSVTSRVDIVPSGISDKAAIALKQVFSSLVPTKGVTEAFAVTWKMIHAEDDDVDVKTKTAKRIGGQTASLQQGDVNNDDAGDLVPTENTNNTEGGEREATTGLKRKRAPA